MKTETKQMETLIEKIKNNKNKSNELRASIVEQTEELMNKVRMALEKEGLDLQPKRNNERDIYIIQELDSYGNRDVRVNFSNGNFNIQIPPVLNGLNTYIQFAIYKVLSQFTNSVVDIQLDMINEYNTDKHDGESELVDMITDKFYNDFLEGSIIKLNGKAYRYIETKKGRNVVEITKIVSWGNEDDKEIKSYFPSNVKDIFRDLSRKQANELTKVK